eukprot:jgi/Mesen1/8827/ME000053S08233
MGTVDYSVGAAQPFFDTVQEPIIYINGKRRVLPDGYAEATLLEYLRALIVRKEGLEGNGKRSHRSVNACLAPLYSVEGTHVVTVEGIGNRRNGLHPVQERLSNAHGSQCGFCTPGFVMSMYTLLRGARAPPTELQIEECLAGNLCRCTGYRPILDAFRVFAKSDAAPYTQEAIAAAAPPGAAPAVQLSTCKGIVLQRPAGARGGMHRYPVLIGTAAVPELNRIEQSESGLEIGGSVTLSRLMAALSRAVEERPPHETRACVAFVEQLRYFAGVQIRNVASVAGNVCTASPISDLNPLWMAAAACFTLRAAGGRQRQVAARDFFTGYRQVDLWEGEILASVFLPWTRPFEYVCEFKQAHRRDDDIAIVNAGMRVRFAEQPLPVPQQGSEEGEGGGAGGQDGAAAPSFSSSSPAAAWVAVEVDLAYGGVAAKSVSAPRTAAFLTGKAWTQATLAGALAVLREEIVIADTAPGGMPEFRRSLVASFLFKFFLHCSYQLEEQANVAHSLPDTWRSAVAPHERPPARGLQYFESSPEGQVAGVSLAHMSADMQIRNVASVAGNVCTASPISDLNPLWMAAAACFTLRAAGGRQRQVAARDFFTGYRQVDLWEGEILASVFLPWTRPFEYVCEFKQAHRRDDDIAIVNAGMRVRFAEQPLPVPQQGSEEGEGGGAGGQDGAAAPSFSSSSPAAAWVAVEVDLAYGGVAAKSVSAPRTAAFLTGKAWTQATLAGALAVLREEIVIADTAPGGMPEFRRSLVASFLFKFFLHCSYQLEEQANVAHSLPDTWRSAVAPHERPPARGLQYFESSPEGQVAGVSLAHMSADMQVSGEAEYVDDLPMPANGLHAALVLSTRPHARLLAIDTSRAAACLGYVAFFGAKDVPGSNRVGAIIHDEEIIGIVVADSHENASAAARQVAVAYEDLPAIFSIEEALEADSWHENFDAADKLELRMGCGDVDTCLASAECDHVIEGRVQMGGQEQFYLETNGTLAWTAPTHHQKDVAMALGLPMHKVVCKTRRIGGGFGGKETRSAIVATAASVAAFHLRRPVKCVLDRHVDMAVTGQRHPFLGIYKVGFTREGRVLALDLALYNNGGNSLDLSGAVLGRAMFHCDNVYAVPNVRVRGRVARTNLPSNTAFRGFGAPQGMMVAENWIERVALAVRRPVDAVRELNMQGEGYILHYGQELRGCHLARIVHEVKETSQYAERRRQVDEFNARHAWRKRGLCMLPTKYGISFVSKFMNQGGALVHIYTDGTVLVTHGGVEMGQGLHTKVAQVAADALGVPVSSVFIAETSTDKVPNSSPTASSTSSDIYGAATRNACLELLARMKPIADLNPGASFQQVVTKCYFERIDLSAHGFYITPDIGFDWALGKGAPFAYYTQGAAVSEVEIDALTGDCQLLRTDILMDLGRSINPAIDIGQWGDREHPWVRPGHLFTQGPGAYKIPAVNDIPADFRVSLLTAVGEPPLFLAASAMFAIKDAIYAARKERGLEGWVALDTPATPERVRMLCTDEFTSPVALPDCRPKLSV